MLETIKGKLAAKFSDSIILESGAFGIRIFLTNRDLLKISRIGLFVKLFLHLSLRLKQQEIEALIFGFFKKDDRDFFRELLKKDHIGVKIAFLILNFSDAKNIKKALRDGNINFFSNCKGVPKKIIKSMFLDAGFTEQFKKKITSEDKKIIEALKKFGYKTKESTEAVLQISERIKKPEKRLKEALKILAKI